MQNPVEKARSLYNSAREKIDPESLATSLTISGASAIPIGVTDALLVYTMQEASKEIDPNLGKFIAVALLGVAGIINVGFEKKALEKQGYNSSALASILNVVSNHPLASSIIDHSIGTTILSLPTAGAAIMGNNPELWLQGAAGAAVAITLWSAPMNSLIEQGKITPVVNGIKEGKERVREFSRNGLVGFDKTLMALEVADRIPSKHDPVELFPGEEVIF